MNNMFGSTDGINVRMDYDQFNDMLNRLSNSMKVETMNKAIKEVMEQELLPKMERNLEKSVSSPEAYSHFKLADNGSPIYCGPTTHGIGWVISIAQKRADYRLHWFENGTFNGERLTKDNKSRGIQEADHFMSSVLEQNADRCAQKMMEAVKSKLSL